MRNRACHEAERTDQVEPIPQVHFCPTGFSCTERCMWMASSVIINRTQYNAAVAIARPKAGVTATGNVALQVAGFTQSLIRRPVITPIRTALAVSCRSVQRDPGLARASS